MTKLFWQQNWVRILIGLIVLAALGFSYYTSTINTLPQASFSLFDQVPSPTATDRVMVVSPHQDDETLGAADLIIHSVAAGAKVEIIFATDGNKHGKKEVRHDEAISADAKLGVPTSQILFFDRPDGELGEAGQFSQFTQQLTTAVKDFQPTIVVTTLPEDDHPDHAACGRAVRDLSSTLTSAKKWFFLIHADRYPRPIGEKPGTYLLPPLDLMTTYNWQVLVANPADQALKRSAIETYRSQLSLTNPILRQLILSFDRRNELFAQSR